MHLVTWVINKLFLVKTITSKEGNLHFKRWRFFACPWLRIYLHKICLPDYDAHMHDHPWNFISLILYGGYVEKYSAGPNYENIYHNTNRPGKIIKRKRSDVHKIEKLINNSNWSLVIAWGKYKIWGYRVDSGWIDHKLYRLNKNG